jgi:hypothetical protein
VALHRCPGCGGQINPHTTTCPWCGHSVAGSVFFQLTLAAVLLVGFASFAGIFRWSKVFPQLAVSDRAMDEPPVPMGAGQPGQGGGSIMDRVFDPKLALPQRVDRVSKMARSEPVQDGRASCRPVGAAKIRALLERYGGWDDQVIAAVACGQVRTGFTVAQVRAAVGMPDTILRREGQEQWVYQDMTLTIQQGRVVSIAR